MPTPNNTPHAIDALPDVFPLWPTAGRFLGLGRNLTFDAARRGEIPTLRFGRRLVVSKVALARLLGEGHLRTVVPMTGGNGPVVLQRRAHP